MIQPLTDASLTAPHGFFTRQGGVSEGGYASLNGSLSGGDDRTRVLANRAAAARALAADPAAMVGLTQVHGAGVVTVREAWAAGAGPAADAMVTDRPGIALCIVTADCAPILLHDPGGGPGCGIVGAAHAGWRGAAGGVIEAVVAAMTVLGAVPARIRAVVGPCIAQASYEVAADMRDAVLAADPPAAAFFAVQDADHWRFDLAGLCVARLRAAGVGGACALGVDTCAQEARFFSYRRRTRRGEGPIGHQMSVIVAASG